MLSIYYTPDKVPPEILISEKFIGGEADVLSICYNLIGGENRLYSAYASLTPAELKPAEGKATGGWIWKPSPSVMPLSYQSVWSESASTQHSTCSA